MTQLFNKKDFKDNCGFGLIANTHGIRSHTVLTKSIDALVSMTHRGGVGSDGKTGDGCGLLFDINHKYFRDTIKQEQDINLDQQFAVGQLFFSDCINNLRPKLEEIFKQESLNLIALREVPINKNILGLVTI